MLKKTKYRGVYIDEKTKKYYIQTAIKDVTGKRKSITKRGFNTAKDGYDYLLKIKTTTDHIDKNKNIVLKDVYLKYIDFQETRLKPKSLQNIKGYFNTNILEHLGNKNIQHITIEDIGNWKKTIIKKNYSYRYSSTLYTSLSSLFNFAIEKHNIINKNVVRLAGNFKNNELKKDINFWTLEEYKKFIEKIENLEEKVFFEVLYYSGARIGELLALNWNDIKDNSIIINKTISKRVIGKKYIITTPKTKSSNRIIKMPLTVISNLNKLKKYYNKFKDYKNKWFIFGGSIPLSETTLTRHKNQYCKDAKVKQIKLHDFRHSHASLLLSNHIPITVIKERLGHSNISITLDIYSHMMIDDENKAVEFLDNIMTKN